MSVPICKIVKFQQRFRLNSQYLNNDTFCRLPVNGPQCIITTGKSSDTGTGINFIYDEHSQGYSQNKETLRALTKNDIHKVYRSLLF